MAATWEQPHSENEHWWSVNDFGCCISYNPRAMLWLIPIIEILAVIIGNTIYLDVASAENQRQQSVNTASTERQQTINWASTEGQQSWVLHLVWSKDYARAMTHDQRIGSIYAQKRHQDFYSPTVNISINRASTISGVVSCIIQGLFYGFYP